MRRTSRRWWQCPTTRQEGQYDNHHQGYEKNIKIMMVVPNNNETNMESWQSTLKTQGEHQNDDGDAY
jgi:hypothetical protein